MICKKESKILSVILCIVMILSLTSLISVSAYEDNTAEISLATRNNTVMVGQSVPIDVMIDFNQDDIVVAGGIMGILYEIKFDSELLQLADPTTGQVVEVDENGNPFDNNAVIFEKGEICNGNALSVSYKPETSSIMFLYAVTKNEYNITQTGKLARFMVKLYDDIPIVNTKSALFDVKSVEVVSANFIENEDGSITFGSPIEMDTIANDYNLTITPPFEMKLVQKVRQNETLEMSGLSSIGPSSDIPLVATITDESGNIIEEKDASMYAIKYSVSFTFDENVYAPGKYTITLTYGDTSASDDFEVVEKYIPPVVEPDIPDEPVVPDEPSTDNSGNDNNDGDSSGNTGSVDSSTKDDNTSSGTTKPDNSGTGSSDSSSSNNSRSDINLGGNKLPSTSNSDSKTDTSDADNKEDNSEILYPSDIDGHWANDNIKYVYDNSLMNGYSDGTFGPDNNITRAEFVTVMARLHGYTEDTAAAAKFTDVSDHWAKGYIGALASMGIVGGVSDTEFAPDENITREQIAAILSRALALTHGDITVKYADDSAISDWAYDSVYSVFEAGYMKGDTANNFNPLNSATRAEVATIIYRLHSAQ